MPGNELSRSQTPGLDADRPSMLVLLGVSVIQFVMAIGSFVLYLKCLGQVHRFSAWKALGAGIPGFLVVVVPLAAIVVFIAVALR